MTTVKLIQIVFDDKDVYQINWSSDTTKEKVKSILEKIAKEVNTK